MKIFETLTLNKARAVTGLRSQNRLSQGTDDVYALKTMQKVEATSCVLERKRATAMETWAKTEKAKAFSYTHSLYTFFLIINHIIV